MTIEDYDQVIAIWRDTEGVCLSDADSREVIQRYLERNPRLSHVAEQDGEIVGAVLCGHDSRRGYMHHLAVLPGSRGRGFGRRLAEACLEQLGLAGIPKCHIFVYVDNESGAQFWRHSGWVERTELKIMSSESRSAPALRKEFASQ